MRSLSQTIHFDPRNGTIHETPPSTPTFMVPASLRQFVIDMTRRAKRVDGVLVYREQDWSRFTLASDRFCDGAGLDHAAANLVDVAPELQGAVAELLRRHGLRAVLSALALDSEVMAYMAETDVMHEWSVRAVDVLARALSDMR